MYLAEYLEKNKDIKLTRENFNEVDATLLALIPLFDVNYVPVLESEAITYEECFEKYIKKEGLRKLGLLLPIDITKLLYDASKTKRYKDLLFFGRYLNISLEEETQTSIMEAKIDDSLTVVIFGGTDDTIIGWKENLNNAFLDKTPCIIHAKEYIDKLPLDRDYIFTGHSKGGQESFYAGCSTHRLANNLVHIYAFDSPGYNLDIYYILSTSPLLNKVTFLCPDSSIVGRILHHPVCTQITRSKDKGALQHNPLGWEIKDNKFIRLKRFKKGSNTLSDDFNNTISNIKRDNLKRFIDCTYKVLSAGGSVYLTDIKKHLLEVNIAFFRLPKEDRSNFIRCLVYTLNKNLIPKSALHESGFLVNTNRLIK